VTDVVVDASALIAIVRGEATAGWLRERVLEAERRLMAAPTLVEVGIVLSARSTDPMLYQQAVRNAEVTVMAFDQAMADRAVRSWQRFGKGRHAAALNFGDCCTYALAEETGLPILCVGDDFARTDLPVLRPE
jgi:ribonuclease VapC